MSAFCGVRDRVVARAYRARRRRTVSAQCIWLARQIDDAKIWTSALYITFK